MPCHASHRSRRLLPTNVPFFRFSLGEALVGNEAVDQLVKFNQALVDNSNVQEPRIIDGIVLTKFDTIDDKVRSRIVPPAPGFVSRAIPLL